MIDIEKLANNLDRAARMTVREGDLEPTIIIVGNEGIVMAIMGFTNEGEKKRAQAEFRVMARGHAATIVAVVVDAWVGTHSNNDDPLLDIRPMDDPCRQEAIVTTVMDRQNGEVITLMSKYVKNGEDVTFGKCETASALLSDWTNGL